MRWFWPVCVLGLLVSPLRGEFEELWSLGVWDGDPQDEYGTSTWEYNAGPGSASALDNDFYFAGTYPAPIGTVAGEPVTNFEPQLNEGNLSVRLHFNLSPAQATSTARMRLNMHQVWGGHWNDLINDYAEGYGTHQLEVFWNGVLLKTAVHTRSDTLIVEANAAAFSPVVGANVLEFRHAPPPACHRADGCCSTRCRWRSIRWRRKTWMATICRAGGSRIMDSATPTDPMPHRMPMTTAGRMRRSSPITRNR